MADVSVYDQAFVYLDGQLLGEATEVKVSLESKDQDVETLVKGWAGQTPSPNKRVVMITSMILTTGAEYPFEKNQRDKVTVECKVQLGGSGKTATGKGFLRDFSLDSGVGKNTVVTFSHHGEPAIFE